MADGSRGDRRRMLVAGVEVRCRTDVPEYLAALDDALWLPGELPAASSPAFATLECELAPGEVRINDRVVVTTPQPENAVALLRYEVGRCVSELHRGWLALHAAGLRSPGRDGRPSDRMVLLIGSSGLGKSTAALSLCDAGWRYEGDDIALLDPPTLAAKGVGWPIRLKAQPETFAALRARGFALGVERWRTDDGQLLVETCLRPPGVPADADVAADAGAPARLAALVFLERGAPAIRPLTAGESLVRFWPRRIEWPPPGADPATRRPAMAPAVLATALAAVPSIVLSSCKPEQVVPLLSRWLGDPSAEAGFAPG